MPEIKQYTSQQPTLQASSLGFQTQPRGDGIIMAAAGEAISTVADAYAARQEENEKTKLMADFAEAQGKLTVENERRFREANPHDPDVGEKFMKEFATPLLDGLGESLQSRGGRDLYARLRANLMADFSVKTAVDQANLAGVGEVKSYETLYNNVTNTAKTDPFAFNYAMGLADEWAANTKGKLSPEQLLKLESGLRTGIAAATVTGLTDRGMFDAAERRLKDGTLDDFIDATQREALQSGIDRARIAAKSAENAAAVEARRVQKEESDAVQKDIAASLIQPDGSLHITPDFFTRINSELVPMPGTEPTTVTAMINFGNAELERQRKGVEIVTDPDVYENFRNRIFKKGDPNALTMPEVYRARTSGLLSREDFALFKSAIEETEADPKRAEQNQQFNALVNGYKKYITNPNPFATDPTDAVTDQMFYDFTRDARPIFERGLAAGKTLQQIEAEIAAGVPRYKISKERAMMLLNEYINRGILPQAIPAPTSDKALPGESYTDWFKRTRGNR